MIVPDKYKNLANAVRNEVYGRDVRESIAKSIEETGASSETAIEITQQLIDGSFDEGVLNTEIERKLNELEREYAPKLTELTEQLAETMQEIEQIGTTTITRTDDLLVSEVEMPTQTVIFTRNNDDVVESVEEAKDDKAIKTTYTRDNNGIVQQIDREMV